MLCWDEQNKQNKCKFPSHELNQNRVDSSILSGSASHACFSCVGLDDRALDDDVTSDEVAVRW